MALAVNWENSLLQKKNTYQGASYNISYIYLHVNIFIIKIYRFFYPFSDMTEE